MESIENIRAEWNLLTSLQGVDPDAKNSIQYIKGARSALSWVMGRSELGHGTASKPSLPFDNRKATEERRANKGAIK